MFKKNNKSLQWICYLYRDKYLQRAVQNEEKVPQ